MEKNFYLIALVWFSFWQSDVQMKSKHTSKWIIRIKLKCFCWEEKRSWKKRKMIAQIFYGKTKLVNLLYIKNNVTIMFM